MADPVTTNILSHPLFENSKIHVGRAEKDAELNLWTYPMTLGGREINTTIDTPPDKITEALSNSKSNAYSLLGNALYGIYDDPGKLSPDIVEVAGKTLSPSIQKAVLVNFLGAPVEISNAVAHAAIDTPINLGVWASRGFEGPFPWGDRYASSDAPMLGAKRWKKEWEAVSKTAGFAREKISDFRERADKWLGEQGLNIDALVVGDTSFADILMVPEFAMRFAEFNLEPNEQNKMLKYISLIGQVAGGAPAEGRAIAAFAMELAKTARNPTIKAVTDTITEIWAKDPARAARLEASIGTLVGTGMVAGVEGLEEVYPNAPQWMKSSVQAGAGLIFPLLATGAVRAAWGTAAQVPIIRWGTRAAEGAIESLLPSGAPKTAARAIQTMGEDWRSRSDVLDALGHLKFAIAEGRHLDKLTRNMYTFPQFARHEARILSEQLKISQRNMSPEEISAAQQKIEDLHRLGIYQEGQLKTLFESAETGAEVYSKYADRMLVRRDDLFEALDAAVFKMDLGGISSQGADPTLIAQDWAAGEGVGGYRYAENRRRAVMEGRTGAVTDETIIGTSEAFRNVEGRFGSLVDEVMKQADEQVAVRRENMPADMDSLQRELFSEDIRRIYDGAYMKIDAYEDVIWNSLKGFDVRKTEEVIGPKDTRLGPELLIEGVPIGEHFANKIAALGAGERALQSKWTFRLSGRRELEKASLEAADPVKAGKALNRITELDNSVTRAQENADRAAEDLATERKALENAQFPPNHPRWLGDKGIGDPARPWDSKESRPLERSLAVVEGRRDRAEDALAKAQDRLTRARADFELISGANVTFEGRPVDLNTEIKNIGELGVRHEGGVPLGRSPKEVRQVISNLKREASFERGLGPTANAARLRAIGQTIDDLQKALVDPENFPWLNQEHMSTAIRLTSLKKDTLEKGPVGELRGYTRDGRPRVLPEKTAEHLAKELVPPGGDVGARVSAQQAGIRQLQTALQPLTVGEGTPWRIVESPDGKLTPEFDPDFALLEYSKAPPPPFELISAGEGRRSSGYRVSADASPTQENIDIVRNILWDKFRMIAGGEGTGKPFNMGAAEKWMQNNEAALGWLKRSTNQETGFEDLVTAEKSAAIINDLTNTNLDDTITALRENGYFREDTITEKDFRDLMTEAAARDRDIAVAATILDNPTALTLGDDFLKKYLGAGKDAEGLLESTLKVLDSGQVEGGTNPALRGFKDAVAESLLRNNLTTRGGGTPAAEDAARLADSLKVPDVKLWDDVKLSEMLDNPLRVHLLKRLYGEAAPEFLRKVIVSAQEQIVISRAAQKGVTVQDTTSTEWAGNIGRFVGGLTAKAMHQMISALVLTGVGRRAAIKAVSNFRGRAVDRLIVDFLMNPELAMAAIEKYPRVSPAANKRMRDRILHWAKETFINKNAQFMKQFPGLPGNIYELMDPKNYGFIDETGDIGDQSSVQPAGPPARRMAASNTPLRTPVRASLLSQASGTGQGPAPTGRQAAEQLAQTAATTPQRMAEMGIPLFANHGGFITGGAGSGVGRMEESGIMSVPRKPRQLVG